MFKSNRSKTGRGIGTSFLICLTSSALLILTFSFIVSLIVGALNDPTRHIGIFSLIAMLISALCSGIICGLINKDGGTGFAALVSLATVLIMLLISLIISGGRVTGGAFMNYACYVGVAVISSLLGKRHSRRHGHKY